MMVRAVSKFVFLVLVSGFVLGTTTVRAEEEKAKESAALKDIRFTEAMWGEEFLMLLAQGPHYLSKDESFDIGAPPENGSEITKAEMNLLLKYQQENRDENTVALIKQEVPKGVFISIFTRDGLVSFIGRNESVEKVIMETVYEVGYFLLREKMKYLRARPYQLAPELAPGLTTVVETPTHSSYPSGHAAQTYAGALILAKIDPENAEKYKDIAHAVGQRREVAGVHYPTDTVAGQKLAVQVVEKLFQVPEFKLKFDRAKEKFEPMKKD